MGTQCSAPTRCCESTNMELEGRFAILERERRVQEHRARLVDEYDMCYTSVVHRGTGEIYSKAKHRKTGQWRLLKQPISGGEASERNSEASRSRLQWSLEALRRCDRPHISRLLEHFSGAEGPCQVLELCGGKSLAAFCSSPIKESVAAVLVRQMSSAIGHLHSHRFCHLELSLPVFTFTKLFSANASIPEMCLKLMDVGLAAPLGSKALMPSSLATFTKRRSSYYNAATIAPEFFASASRRRTLDGAACDVYALGALAFSMLTSKWPVVTTNSVTAADAKSSQVWHNVSYSGRNFVEQCLAVNPEARPTLAHLLEKSSWMARAHATYTAAMDAEEADSRKRSSILSVSQLSSTDILEAFKEVASMDILQRAIITAAVHRLPDHKTCHLRRVFTKLDTDGNGCLTVDELVRGLGDFYESVGTVEEYKDILEKLDTDGNRVIDYTEFLAATFSCRQAFREDVCVAAFALFDEDDSGEITLDEILEALGAENKRGFNRDELKACLAKYDVDGDETISFKEFKIMLRGDLTDGVGSRRGSKHSHATGRRGETKDDQLTTVSTTASTTPSRRDSSPDAPDEIEPFPKAIRDNVPLVYVSHRSDSSPAPGPYASHRSQSSAIGRGMMIAGRLAGKLKRSLSGTSTGSRQGVTDRLKQHGAKVKQKAKATLARGADYAMGKTKKERKPKAGSKQ
eukprot:TRINITY_DN36955_c0_g1_i1.p1 TRINITY_DN36955_c0_g1~~TRINITY_DN36955_c0_g1_i1.p1  ORF type:complete len:688 (-),score=100.60 TRINITY_DN36955_c0_g1_i1:197-2260(-)